MIVTKLSDGLGNQMFQYAAGKALSLKWDKELLIDISSYRKRYPGVDQRKYGLHIFKKIRPKISSSFLTGSFYMPLRWDNRIKRLFGVKKRNALIENKTSFNNEFTTAVPPLLLDGYWQSEKYFKEYESEIRDDFHLPDLKRYDPAFPFFRDIQANESVSVHVRRGDYYSYGEENKFAGICNQEYFQKAIHRFTSYRPDLKFFFFSEDPKWIEENLLTNNINGLTVTGNLGDHSWKDLYLMTKCKHHILSNSSFSWWGAWLNIYKGKKVVAPRKWFRTDDPFYEPNDIVPVEWERI